MNRIFLDFLYARKHECQARIDKLEEENTHPRDGKCKECGDVIKASLFLEYDHRAELDKIITAYLDS